MAEQHELEFLSEEFDKLQLEKKLEIKKAGSRAAGATNIRKPRDTRKFTCQVNKPFIIQYYPVKSEEIEETIECHNAIEAAKIAKVDKCTIYKAQKGKKISGDSRIFDVKVIPYQITLIIEDVERGSDGIQIIKTLKKYSSQVDGLRQANLARKALSEATGIAASRISSVLRFMYKKLLVDDVDDAKFATADDADDKVDEPPKVIMGAVKATL